jgi:hypothetical protein
VLPLQSLKCAHCFKEQVRPPEWLYGACVTLRSGWDWLVGSGRRRGRRSRTAVCDKAGKSLRCRLAAVGTGVLRIERQVSGGVFGLLLGISEFLTDPAGRKRRLKSPESRAQRRRGSGERRGSSVV